MNCLGIARKACLVAGAGDSDNKVNAFDNALIAAHINDFNLIPVSSILAKETEIVQGFDAVIEPGSFVPCVLSKIESAKKGEHIVAAVAAAKFANGIGFVAALRENAKTVSSAKKVLTDMLLLAAKERKTSIVGEPFFVFSEHKTKNNGCAVAALVYVF